MKLRDTSILENFLQELEKDYIEAKEKAKDGCRIAQMGEGVCVVNAVRCMLLDCPEYEVHRANIVDPEKHTSESALFVHENTPCESMSGEPRNVLEHRAICNELNSLYERKNRDYGDSFHKTYLEEGMAMARIRLTDKLERFKKLTREGGQEVKDEGIRDTLIDLANYAIMTVMELDREAAE